MKFMVEQLRIFCAVAILFQCTAGMTSSLSEMKESNNKSYHVTTNENPSLLKFPNSSWKDETFSNISMPNMQSPLQELRNLLSEHLSSFTSEKEDSVVHHGSLKYMIDLYQMKSGNLEPQKRINRKSNSALKRSDVVRCLEPVDLYREDEILHFVFDLSVVKFEEKIKMVEIKLTFLQDRNNTTSITIWDERKVDAENKPTLVRTRIGKVSMEKFERKQIKTLDFTRLFRQWMNSFQRNKRLAKEAKVESRVSHAKRFGNKDHEVFLDSVPMMFVYSQHKDCSLIDVAASRQSRGRRSSKRGQVRNRVRSRYRKPKRKHRRRNRTERLPKVQEIRHNQIELVARRRQKVIYTKEHGKQVSRRIETDEIKQWHTLQSSVSDVVIEDTKEETKVPRLTQPEHSVPHPEHQRPKRNCRKVDYYVDFEKVGWDDWIIFPTRFNAYKCMGDCQTIMPDNREHSNHAYIQNLLSENRPHRQIPAPCCTPSKLYPLSILYYENGIIKQREHEGMVVAECDCR